MPFYLITIHHKSLKSCHFNSLDDHRQLVEPACGASLAAVYSGILKDLQTQGQLGEIKSALIVVCGGSAVSLDVLDKWKKEFDL